MKKRIVSKMLVFVFSLFPFFVLSQEISGGVEITSGYTDGGFAFNGNYNHYTSEEVYYKGGVYMSFAEVEVAGFDVSYQNITMNLGYYRKIHNPFSKESRLYVGAGGVFGHEGVNKGRETLPNNALLLTETSNLIYGLFVGVEMELYISRTISAIIKANEYYHINSDLGQFTFYGGAGLRYFLF